MGVLAEAAIAAFDSNAEITWDLKDPATAVASFQVAGQTVRTTFAETSTHEWRVAFEVAPANRNATEMLGLSLRILGGVFQCVREFLEVRQPMKLVFASKTESLGDLYEAYLQREDTELARMGYRAMPPVKSSPLAEFMIVKQSRSEWHQA